MENFVLFLFIISLFQRTPGWTGQTRVDRVDRISEIKVDRIHQGRQGRQDFEKRRGRYDFKRGGQGGEDLGLELRIILFPKTPEGSNHHLNFSVYSFEVSKLMKLDMDDSYNLFLF